MTSTHGWRVIRTSESGNRRTILKGLTREAAESYCAEHVMEGHLHFGPEENKRQERRATRRTGNREVNRGR